jgi:hypothetical protein
MGYIFTSEILEFLKFNLDHPNPSLSSISFSHPFPETIEQRRPISSQTLTAAA